MQRLTGIWQKGATLIFAASVSHAESIAEKIPDSVVITGKQKIVRISLMRLPKEKSLVL